MSTPLTTTMLLMPAPSFSGDEHKQSIYLRLKDWIIFTELAPGQRLNERDLAEQFGISRTPMREILQLLSYQGLLIIRPRQGVFVAPIEPDLIREVFEVRLPIEREVAVLAARRCVLSDIEELHAIAERTSKALTAADYAEAIRLDALFHDTLGKMSGNPTLRRIREALHNICLRYWFLIRNQYNPKQANLATHILITEAIANHDENAAAELHTEHVSNFLKLL